MAEAVKTVTKSFVGSRYVVTGKATLKWQNAQIDDDFYPEKYVLERLAPYPHKRWQLTITMTKGRK